MGPIWLAVSFGVVFPDDFSIDTDEGDVFYAFTSAVLSALGVPPVRAVDHTGSKFPGPFPGVPLVLGGRLRRANMVIMGVARFGCVSCQWYVVGHSVCWL